MYNPDNRQYLFRDSSGKITNIYYDEKLGLCLSFLTKRNIWTEPVAVSKDASRTFCADMDNNDAIHLFYQDKDGNLFYTRSSWQADNAIPVLKSKSPTPYNKYLEILVQNSTIHLFYVLQHNNERLLAYQAITDSKPGNPRVIDYVTKSPLPYSIVSDKAGSIYVFYQSSDGSYLQLGYKKYIPSQKFWSDFTPVTRYPGNCEFPVVISSPEGILHMCYQRHAAKQYELVYQQKIPDKNIWTGETVIHTSSFAFDTASMVLSPEGLFLYWVRDDVIFYSMSQDGGNTWMKPVRHNHSATRQLFCMSYKTNFLAEYEKITARYIPGSYINGLRFVFYQLPSDHTPISPEDLKNTIVDSLKLLNAGYEELKESDAGLREEIYRMEAAQKNLERDSVKISLKLGMLEEEINKMRNLHEKIDQLSLSLKEVTEAFTAMRKQMDRPGQKNEKETCGQMPENNDPVE